MAERRLWMKKAFANARGQLKATAKRTGKSYGELAHSRSGLTRRRAALALTAGRIARRRKRGT